MAPVESFPDLMARVHRGEPGAAEKVVELYEPQIRRFIRYRLTPTLRRVYDSLDICQSVLVAFLQRAAGPEWEKRWQERWDDPSHLVALLRQMARDNVARKARTRKTNPLPDCLGPGGLEALADEGRDFLDSLADRDLLARARQCVAPSEWELIEKWVSGSTHAAIAAELNSTAEAIRKRIRRAVERIREQIGHSGG